MIDEPENDWRKETKASFRPSSRILQAFIHSLYTLPLSEMGIGCPSSSRQGILAQYPVVPSESLILKREPNVQRL